MSIGEDTTVNNTSYYKIIRATGGEEIPDQFYGLIREDNSQRIYYKSSYDKPEKLLYDFSISENDTITVYGLTDRSNDYYDECQYVCDSIGDEMFYDNQRKVIYLTAILESFQEKWIEGIGSTTGLLHHSDGRVGGDAFELSCVRSLDDFLYRMDETVPCIKTNTGIVNPESDDLVIFPNPIVKDDGLNIKNIPSGTTIEVYDIVGKLVYSHNFNSSEETIKIKAKPGIYLYNISDSEKRNIKTGKLFIE